MQRRHAVEFRLRGAGLGCVQQHKVMNTIGLRPGQNCAQLRHLRRRSCHNELAAGVVRHIARAAVVVQHPPALHTQGGFQRSSGVVDTSMDDFTVARTGLCTNGGIRLQHQHVTPLLRERTRDRQADHTSTNHHTIYCFTVHLHGPSLSAHVAGVPSYPRAQGHGILPAQHVATET